MSALTHADVADVDLTRLGSAVADWKRTAAHLKALSAQARTGLLAKSERARWEGVNAAVTRDFIRRTTKEFADALAEAQSIVKVIEDAHLELVKIQKAVRHIREVEGPKLGLNLTVQNDWANLQYRPGTFDKAVPRTTQPHDEAAVQALHSRLSVLVAHAAEIDASVARALSGSHGNDATHFGHRAYGSLDDAQQERALELARSGPSMTEDQYAEFNSIMKFNAKDADFSTAFYRGLGGPKQALDFYARMSLHGTEGDDPTRLAQVQELQRSMGTALASATDPDNKPHLPTSWGPEFRKLGTQPIEYDPLASNRPYGYQILGGLLRYGDYDPRFISPIAEDILRLHKEDPNRFMENRPYAPNDPDYGFNPSGRTGAGYDPLTSVLEGLGHSPEAAKQFFADGEHLAELTSNEFEWAADTLDRSTDDEALEDARKGGPDALGHALEAATTGHPWDDVRPGLHRDEGTAAIMKKVIDLYSPTSEVKPHEEMMDSLGRMGAAYIDDLNYSSDNFGGSGREMGREERYAYSSDGSKRTDFDLMKVRNFMTLVARSEEGYKSLSTAQEFFTASGLAAFRKDHMNGSEIASTSAEMHGIIDGARSTQIRADARELGDNENLKLEQQGAWRQFGVSTCVEVAVGAGSTLVAGPAAGVIASQAVPMLLEAGGAAVNTAYGNSMLEYLKANEADHSATAVEQSQHIETVGTKAAWRPIERYMDTSGMPTDQRLILRDRVNNAYDRGMGKTDAAEKAS
ncbi:hypothetical protein [Streptomyces candidus]|uniref:AG2 protein n=1 Tax=Streptomyces candidus TaxID=67283 RepID=A0A7X0HF93_9ACTN|nr:hypothetical protein [Streptomyces candidus]MBB6436554.1 hypothetical protein [Streptomyces candidus]GHH49387.1 hypothetical protein GCM10018773_44980 [Streptomyces candidus]